MADETQHPSLPADLDEETRIVIEARRLASECLDPFIGEWKKKVAELEAHLDVAHTQAEEEKSARERMEIRLRGSHALIQLISMLAGDANGDTRKCRHAVAAIDAACKHAFDPIETLSSLPLVLDICQKPSQLVIHYPDGRTLTLDINIPALQDDFGLPLPQ